MFPLYLLLLVFHLGFPLLQLPLQPAPANTVATFIATSLSAQAHSRSDWQQPQNAARAIPRRYKHKVSHT